MKPLEKKNYGSIGHLPNSRLGPGDHKMNEGQAKILTEKARDKHDTIIVQEKLDGSNVGVCKVDGEIIAINRAGYRCSDSPRQLHRDFDDFVMSDPSRFNDILSDRWRICGEWLGTPHGTIYDLKHEPFVVFDMFSQENIRVPHNNVEEYCELVGLTTPFVVHHGGPISVNAALEILGENGKHGAQEPCEGLVYRCERKGKVDFLAKYVKPGKIDGKYFKRKP